MRRLARRLGLGGGPAWRASGVLACVDGSSYLASVCDHAAWAAERLGSAVELLNVLERRPSRPAEAHSGGRPHELPESLWAAASRLREAGVEPLELCVAEGSPAATIRRLSQGAALVVLGRRGLSREGEPAAVGRNVLDLARTCRAAVLVAAHVFLPLREALVLDDPGRPDPAFADLIATSPWLDELNVRRAGIRRGGSARSWRPRRSGEDAADTDLQVDGAAALSATADLVLVSKRWLEPLAAGRARRVVAALLRSPRSVLFC